MSRGITRPPPYAAASPRRVKAQARSRKSTRRRRRVAAGIAALVALFVAWPVLHHAFEEFTLPLRHEDIIRQQAREKALDPSLIAAVIYAESKFRDNRTSSAGALGLMQLTPATARDIARKSGGIAFKVEDLGTPQVNIAYGAYYLRYLLDRYGGNETFALAAYNAGEGNVDRWIDAARRQGKALTADAIPFSETRAYVKKVERLQGDYRHKYAHELGLTQRG